MKLRWNSLDCLKGIACIAVVLIHYNFPGDFGLAVKSFCRFAVPVFLIISGFFFLSDGKMDDAKTVKKIRNILYLLMVSALFYACFAFFDYGALNSNFSITGFINERLQGGKIVKLFLTNDPFVYSHLWYMLALVYCYMFCLLVFSKNRELHGAGIIAVVLLVCYTCLQEFASILHVKNSFLIIGTEQYVSLFNLFIFRALPFFMFGVTIRKHISKVMNIPLKKGWAIVLFVFGGALAAYEHLNINNAQFFVGNYIQVFALIVMAIKNEDYKSKLLGFIGYVGRELSLYVYILHIAIGKSIHIIARMLEISHRKFYLYSRAGLTVAISLLVAYLIVTLMKYINKNVN